MRYWCSSQSAVLVGAGGQCQIASRAGARPARAQFGRLLVDGHPCRQIIGRVVAALQLLAQLGKPSRWVARQAKGGQFRLGRMVRRPRRLQFGRQAHHPLAGGMVEATAEVAQQFGGSLPLGHPFVERHQPMADGRQLVPIALRHPLPPLAKQHLQKRFVRGELRGELLRLENAIHQGDVQLGVIGQIGAGEAAQGGEGAAVTAREPAQGTATAVVDQWLAQGEHILPPRRGDEPLVPCWCKTAKRVPTSRAVTRLGAAVCHSAVPACTAKRLGAVANSRPLSSKLSV